MVDDLQLLAGLRVRAVEHRDDLTVVLRREAVQLQVLAGFDVRLALGDLRRRDARRREQLGHVRAGQLLERAGVGDLMDATANQQVPGERTRGRVVAHLVHAQLAGAGARLEEVVVCQIFDQVTRGVHYGAGPRLAVRVGGGRPRYRSCSGACTPRCSCRGCPRP